LASGARLRVQHDEANSCVADDQTDLVSVSLGNEPNPRREFDVVELAVQGIGVTDALDALEPLGQLEPPRLDDICDAR
jgi:hypothetical protein